MFLALLVSWTLWRRRGRRIRELTEHNELARRAAEQSDRAHAEELKEAERQNVIARRIAADEEERRRAAESRLAPEAGPAPSAAGTPAGHSGRHRREDGAPEADTRS